MKKVLLVLSFVAAACGGGSGGGYTQDEHMTAYRRCIAGESNCASVENEDECDAACYPFKVTEYEDGICACD